MRQTGKTPQTKNGAITRRTMLQAGIGGAIALPAIARGGDKEELVSEAMRVPGAPASLYGSPSRFEEKSVRLLTPLSSASPGTGSARTPLHLLDGIITPSGLHYERHHNGVPDIDPAQHLLLVHGLVRRPLEISVEALLRYPRTSRVAFLECAGNSGANAAEEPPQTSVDLIHGLISCSEWTGVPLKLLLDEAGILDGAEWLIAEGGDASALSRSIPLAEAYKHGIVALYQNGERLRPEQGYPVRLFMPGWEGSLNVKWLRRIKLTRKPVFAREETSKYTQLQPDGLARQFDFVMGVKSVILLPSVGMRLPEKAFYEISGLAWSGHGRVTEVKVTTDGGKSWMQAELQEPVLPQCLVRFRLRWHWDGGSTILQSIATDEAGHTQPTHSAWKAHYAPGQGYHYNAIQSWQVKADGVVKNVRA